MSGDSKKIVNDGLSGNVKSNQRVLLVPPLTSKPYVGLLSSHTASSSTVKFEDNVGKPEPAMLSVPGHSSPAETNTGVVLEGSAAMGLIGPTIGHMDLFDSDEHYFFRVSLPGVSSVEKTFRCDIDDNKTIVIKGSTTTGEETVCRYSQVFKIQSQNLSPPGPFTISYKLPGPVHNEEFTSKLEFGVLQGKVKKMRIKSEPDQL